MTTAGEPNVSRLIWFQIVVPALNIELFAQVRVHTTTHQAQTSPQQTDKRKIEMVNITHDTILSRQFNN